jgi:hypothetical protein
MQYRKVPDGQIQELFLWSFLAAFPIALRMQFINFFGASALRMQYRQFSYPIIYLDIYSDSPIRSESWARSQARGDRKPAEFTGGIVKTL